MALKIYYVGVPKEEAPLLKEKEFLFFILEKSSYNNVPSQKQQLFP